MAAWSLAYVTNSLIARRELDSAERIARVSTRLRPDEPRFDMQLQLIELLRAYDVAGLTRRLDTHPSFGKGGWLEWVRPMLERLL